MHESVAVPPAEDGVDGVGATGCTFPSAAGEFDGALPDALLCMFACVIALKSVGGLYLNGFAYALVLNSRFIEVPNIIP